MLQLGQRSSERDVWLWVPAGTGHNQSSPWISATSLSHWRECNELHFIGSLPSQAIQLITSTADFIRSFPPMSAAVLQAAPTAGCSGHAAHEVELNWATEQDVTNPSNDTGKPWKTVRRSTSSSSCQLLTSSQPTMQRRLFKDLQISVQLFIFSIQVLPSAQASFGQNKE